MERVHVRLTRRQLETLDQLAAEQGERKRSQVLRELLADAIKRIRDASRAKEARLRRSERERG